MQSLDPTPKAYHPHKHLDHIPIHGSGVTSFKSCRLAWHFSDPSRMALRPTVKYAGLSWNLWFGSVVHYALEKFYDPILRRDPVEVFETAFYEGCFNEDGGVDVQGINELHRIAPTWYDANKDKIEYHLELGTGMMTNYVEWCEKADADLEVLQTETTFAIEVGEGIDWRDHQRKSIVYKGKIDAVVRSRSTGRISIIDHKTAASIAEDYFDKLEIDEQVTRYIWAARKVLDQPVAGVWYNVLRKAIATDPTPIYGGKQLSVARATETTTPERFMRAISENDLDNWFAESEKAQAYYRYLQNDQAAQWFVRRWVARNDHEIAMVDQQIAQEVEDMTRKNLNIYRTPSQYKCKTCPFKAPCIALYDGSDYNGMLAENYEPITNR